MERAKQNRLLVWLLVCVMLLSAVSGLAYAEEITDVAEMPTTCTVTEGCTLPAGHEGECVLPTAEDTTTACTVTEGCTLPAGHEGECVLPTAEDTTTACTVTEGCTLPAGHEGECVLPAVQVDDTAEDVEAGTMTLKDFITKVGEGNGTFDGQGITVKWEPDETEVKINRIQNENAQYQIFSGLDDLHISNVHFEYIPADILNHTDPWNAGGGSWTANEIRNGEFQFLNSGDVTLENCTFEKVMTSPYSTGSFSDATFTVTGCSYSNVYNAYAIKDICQSTAVIFDNTFENCSGAIYFRNSALQSVTIEKNQFINIDQYAKTESEKNKRGIIQLDAGCTPSEDSAIRIENNTISENVVNDGMNGGELPVIRQICNMGDVTIQGWTPGEAFSIKPEFLNRLTLPSMPSDDTHTFKGWAASTDYKGPTDCANADKFLKGGETAVSGIYYAVWEVRYTVTYTDGVEDETVFEDQITTDLLSGTKTPTFQGEPERKGYVFAGWKPAVAETVTADVVYTAQWTVEQKPVDPEEPSKPDEPTATPAPEATVTPAPTTSPTPEESAIDSPKTGDETNLLLPLAMLGMAGGLLVTLFAAKRAKNRR